MYIMFLEVGISLFIQLVLNCMSQIDLIATAYKMSEG
jgi:hypothetical protein